MGYIQTGNTFYNIGTGTIFVGTIEDALKRTFYEKKKKMARKSILNIFKNS